VIKSWRDLLFILKKAVQATDQHRSTLIRMSGQRNSRQPMAERFFPKKSVFICVHLWLSFPAFFPALTAGAPAANIPP
jgi:hypothetical protein